MRTEHRQGPAALGALGWLILLVLAAMPWPLASNRVWIVGLGLVVVTPLALWQLWAAGSDRRWPLGVAPGLRLHMALLLAFTAWVGMQLVPLPAGLRDLVEHSRAAGYPLPRTGWAPLTVDPWLTQAYLARALLFLLLQWLILTVFDTRPRIERLLLVWLAVGVVEAVAGVVLFAQGQSYDLLFAHVVQGVHAKGSFVYQNHFAGYMEMMLALATGWMIAMLGRDAPAGRHRGVLNLVFQSVRFLSSGKALLRVAMIVLVVGLIASRSRMGNAAFFVALWLVGGATLWALRRSRQGRGAARAIAVLMASILVLDIVLIGGVVGIDRVVQRIEATHLAALPEQPRAAAPANEDDDAAAVREESVEQRVGPGLHALRMLADFPVAGTGGGSFQVAYFPYRPAEVLGFYDHAHDDFVEFATDTGLVGVALLGTLLAWSQWRGWRLLLARSSTAFERGMAFASVMAATELLLHSTVDFNMQNPTNAVLFLWIISLPHQLYARKFRHAGNPASEPREASRRISSPAV